MAGPSDHGQPPETQQELEYRRIGKLLAARVATAKPEQGQGKVPIMYIMSTNYKAFWRTTRMLFLPLGLALLAGLESSLLNLARDCGYWSRAFARCRFCAASLAMRLRHPRGIGELHFAGNGVISPAYRRYDRRPETAAKWLAAAAVYRR